MSKNIYLTDMDLEFLKKLTSDALVIWFLNNPHSIVKIENNFVLNLYLRAANKITEKYKTELEYQQIYNRLIHKIFDYQLVQNFFN